ncbi:D-amino-acid oxidase [Epithele typhae]|uniref:D-amino-acid oxidase n=1 Tax=Epithele typhae TaxID=378194 RepID=UPI002007F2B5|nr:D-amino-acid oxidase [Epithele typhae]KAH9941123.1 D-amino-acid oxidase [Epithele typhae]
MSTVPKNIVVIGAGVVGLTTAVKLQEKGRYNITIVAETSCTDAKSVRYTSLWAGAHHVSHAGLNAREMAIDRETFDVMWELSAPGSEAEHCFMRVSQTDYLLDGRDEGLDWMPDFKTLPQESLAHGAVCATSFTTVNIDTPIYLLYLRSRFLKAGGVIVTSSVQHVQQIIEGGPEVLRTGTTRPTSVDGLIICAGLGARTLGGVEDKAVFPVRGQIVLVNAPWITFGRTVSHAEKGMWTYVIRRRSGNVVLGGTKEEDDWYPVARPATTTDILERCLAICPELVPAEIRKSRAGTIDDLRELIVDEGCGFRPQRKGGIRLDVEWVPRRAGQGKVPMVFNYGHGGGGYQSSWGSASIALDLLEKALASAEEQ